MKPHRVRDSLVGAAAFILALTLAPPLAWAQAPLSPAEGRLGARLLDSATMSGVVVQQIVPGSAADQAGIKSRDLILRFQGTPVKDLSHFSALVLAAPAGQSVPVELLHGAKIEQRGVVLPPVMAAPGPRPGAGPPAGLPATIVGDDGQPMVLIPAGEFIMGEVEPKRVHLDAYYIDQYEVTNAMWDRVVPVSKRRPKSLCDRCPVINVSWYEAESYCKKVGKRLPTDAEWEKSARGPEGQTYVWGAQFRPGLANVIGRADEFSFTAPIGSFSLDKSLYGVFDLAGNVAEWTASWYQSGYEITMPRSNPKGPERGDFKVHRGASWKSPTKKTRATTHDWSFPEDKYETVGFRCAMKAAGTAVAGRPPARPLPLRPAPRVAQPPPPAAPVVPPRGPAPPPASKLVQIAVTGTGMPAGKSFKQVAVVVRPDRPPESVQLKVVQGSNNITSSYEAASTSNTVRCSGSGTDVILCTPVAAGAGERDKVVLRARVPGYRTLEVYFKILRPGP